VEKSFKPNLVLKESIVVKNVQTKPVKDESLGLE
jgi:hypothetical protein